MTCLEHLFKQEGADFEVIVVDDGSIDGTEAAVQASTYVGMPNFKYIRQEASHQGVARNRGVSEARGDLIVFIGDDIFAQPGFLATHAKAHQENPNENAVVLGFTTWDPALPINSIMHFMEDSGWQFGYKFLKPGLVNRSDRWKFFYTSNISVKKSYFAKERFDESFREYGWEDIELGYRLAKRHDLKLFYEPQAVGYHHHPMDEERFFIRMEKVGQSARVFEKIHPDVRLVPRGCKKLLIILTSCDLLQRFVRRFSRTWFYKLRSWQRFMTGVNRSV